MIINAISSLRENSRRFLNSMKWFSFNMPKFCTLTVVRHMMELPLCQVERMECRPSPLALFTHCYAHCLNLSIAASCKLSEVRNFIGLINKAYLFLNNSPKRQQLFELTLKEYLPKNSHRKLPGLCKTRWVERHTCLDLFLEIYELLVTFLDAVISPPRVPKLEIVY